MVFPTPVGMNRLTGVRPQAIEGIPHARGDEPFLQDLNAGDVVYSPRPWG